MNSGAEFRYYWIENNQQSRVPDGWESVSDGDFQEVRGRTESIAEPGDKVQLWAQDLVRIARAVYVADRKALRRGGDDGWTRNLCLSVPLSEADPWSDRTVTGLLRDLLATLTGDRWDVVFRSGARAYPSQTRLTDNWQAADVALLSGGLDSTSFAADLAMRMGADVLFVMFYDPKMKQPQQHVLHEIHALSRRPIHRRQISQTVLGSGSPLEPSSRSRGLLYMAAAVYAAAAHGARTVLVPENGQLAINLPLTASRAAACSTRSVHPHTLSLFNDLILRIGGEISVMNPLVGCTKGEVCLRGRDAGLSAGVLYSTVSCSHPPVKRRGRAPYHCGYCYPCLVRRAGLLRALHDDRTQYQYNPWNMTYKDARTEDLRALQYWLCRPLAVQDLIADLPLPGNVLPASLIPVQGRARQELSAMLDAMIPANSAFRRNWAPIP